jgi:uncharacterized glyoxalase superfamily protein PhnB
MEPGTKRILEMAFTKVAPLIRIFDENKAKEFYIDFLGFSIDFEHRHFEGAPLYMQIRKGDCLLLLTEHYGDCTPGCAINIETDELKSFHEELKKKQYKYANPGIKEMPWGSKNMTISDPFGNRITFTDAIST